MPEGHTVHRLARAFGELFVGERLAVSSPQGRFAAGAALLDGHVLVASEAWGKQLFLGFADPALAGPGTAGRPDDVRWLRVHLGLYGAWTFAGDGSTAVVHAIGAPRRRIGERETVPAGPGAIEPGPDDAWSPPPPRGAVRVRLVGAHAVADLTGPTACEVITTEEKTAVEARLGPDPIRDDGDVEAFVARVGRSRVTIGQQLMDQAVVAGVGNIYRAEALFRAGVDPLRPGRDVPAETVRAIWYDLTTLMRDGTAQGAIVTTDPADRPTGEAGRERGYDRGEGSDEHKPVFDGRRRTRQNTDGTPGAVPSDQAFYVYHRAGQPCRICGTPVLTKELAGRNLFWCPTCQT